MVRAVGGPHGRSTRGQRSRGGFCRPDGGGAIARHRTRGRGPRANSRPRRSAMRALLLRWHARAAWRWLQPPPRDLSALCRP
eukprot:4832031-Prymnesium_polylepis.1